MVVLARHIHRGAVGQVAALGEIHAHDGIAQVQQGKIDGQIGLCAGVGLDVGVLGPKQPAGPLDGNVFHLIHIGTAAVIPLAGQALGVLVGQDAAHGRHHSGRDDILAGNKLDVLALAFQLPAHGCGQFRVSLSHQTDGIHHFVVHTALPLSDTNILKKAETSLCPASLLFSTIAEQAKIFNRILDKNACIWGPQRLL